jgi:hypothetical protein
MAEFKYLNQKHTTVEDFQEQKSNKRFIDNYLDNSYLDTDKLL